jgi:hypothetical protein
MPNNVQISTEDVVKNRAFLEAMLSRNIPAGNFSSGAHLHDILVNGYAYILSLIDAEVSEIRGMLAFDRVSQLNDVSADRVVDDLASNWFISRKDGTFARGFVTVYESDNGPKTIPVGTVFTRTAGVDFVYDGSTPLVVDDSSMETIFDTAGNIESYSYKVPVVSRVAGIGGDLSPGLFESFDSYSNTIIRVENQSYFSSGDIDETSLALAERAKESVSLRGFLTEKSIKATILDGVPEATNVVVIGAGDSEMQRDLVLDPVTNTNTYHALGHVNVYTQLPPLTNQTYSVELASGVDTVTLPAGPYYRITEVAVTTIVAPAGTEAFSRLSPVLVSVGDYQCLLAGAGTTNRASALPGTGEYTLSFTTNDESYSSSESPVITLPALGGSPEIRNIKVSYTTVSADESATALIEDDSIGSVAANYESYFFYPALVSISINYILKATAPGELPLTSVKSTIAEYITNFSVASDTFRVSNIVTLLLSVYSDYLAGIAYPVTVSYLLEGPDGRQVLFNTTDKFTVEDAALLADADNLSSSDRTLLQLSDRTVRFICFNDTITLTEVN